MLDRLRQGSTAAADSSCRRRVEVNIGEAKMRRKFNRKKMELRRIRSVSDRKSGDLVVSCDDVVSYRKKRSDVKYKMKLIENALLMQLPEKEAEGSGKETTLRHGVVSIIGRRREMEDAVAAELGFLKRGGKSYDFFGVYDGHGGWRVARACSEMLHKLLVKAVGDDVGEEVAWERVMVAGFKEMDEEVNKNGAAVATTGSTAVVAVVGEEEVVVAHCGDSRAVLSRGGFAVQLSDDHKPDRADELQRIEAGGGKVINWNGHRVLGVLATSRSIGDQFLKPFVIADPEVKVIRRTKSDEFLVLASDGLWDVISNDFACNVARRCLDGRIKKSGGIDGAAGESGSVTAATVLAELAMARGSNDNISVVVVDLRSYGGQIDGFSC